MLYFSLILSTDVSFISNKADNLNVLRYRFNIKVFFNVFIHSMDLRRREKATLQKKRKEKKKQLKCTILNSLVINGFKFLRSYLYAKELR